jgi:hypothetical protein
MKATVTLVIALLVVPGSGFAADALASTDVTVLNAVIHSLCADKDLRPPIGKYNIVSGQTHLVYGEIIEKVDPDAAISLKSRNASPHELSHLESCTTERFEPDVKVGPNFDWDGFFTESPDSVGITEFSLPGYSNDRRRAIVGISFRCQSFCAFGGYWVLEKTNDGWLVVRKIHAWMT